MNLSNLKPVPGSKEKHKRVGRGESSGLGKTSGRGNKGQKSRTGNGKISAFFEGGQVPITRRLPKFGFANIHRREQAVVNLSTLNAFDAGAVVDAKILQEKGLVKKKLPGGLKVLGDGELKKAITVKAQAFSAKAKEQIEKAGGKAEVVK
jgi:large subunit ribosomal protein L15